MKIALLLYGYIGNFSKIMNNPNDLDYNTNEYFLKLIYNHWKKYLFNETDVDIFIHSWNHKSEKLFKKFFNPKKILLEKSMENSEEVENIKTQIKLNGAHLTTNGRINQLLSIQRVWKLFEPHANNYDIIIHSRIPMCLHKPFPLDKLKPNTIYTVKLLNGTKGPYHHHIHGFFEDPILSTSVKGSREYANSLEYLLDKNKYELWKNHDGHFNNSLNCVSAHRTTYHIFHILKKFHNINWNWIPDFIYTNHYHSSSFNYCRHLYFGHLDVYNRRGLDPMFDNMEKREELQLKENIKLLKNEIKLNYINVLNG